MNHNDYFIEEEEEAEVIIVILSFEEEEYYEFIDFCSQDNLVAVKEYLKKYPNHINGLKNHINPLFNAIKQKKYNISDYLITIGADINLKLDINDYDYSEQTILQTIIEWCTPVDYDIVEELGMDNYDWGTEQILYMIKNNVDVNKCDTQGCTPLDYTFFYPNEVAEKLLIQYGAKHSKVFLENSGLIYYTENEISEIEYIDTEYEGKYDEKLLPYQEVMKSDLKSHREKCTELSCSILKHYYLEDIWNPNELDKKGRTALDFALEIGHTEVERYLKVIGAKLSKDL